MRDSVVIVVNLSGTQSD